MRVRLSRMASYSPRRTERSRFASSRISIASSRIASSSLDEIVLAGDIGVIGAGAALLQEPVAGIGIEQQVGIAERDQRAQHSDTEEQPGLDVDDAERVGAQAREHLLPGVGDERARRLAVMGERQVEDDRDREIGEEGDEPEQLAQPVAVVELAHADRAGEKRHADVEKREHQRFGGAADIAELAALGEEEAVEKHLEDEQAQQDADLEGEVAAGRPARGALELVAPAKVVALDLDVAQMSAQAVQLVAALGGLGAELAHRGGCRLPDGREPALEVEAGQPLLVEVQLVEQDAVGAVLLGLDALDDQALDVVENGELEDGSSLAPRWAPSCPT